MQAKAYLIDGRKSAFTELICAQTLRLARLSSQAELTQTGSGLNTHKNALQILQSRVIFAA